MPEIDDATLAQLRGAHVLLDKMLRDPKTRRDTERLVKTHKPDFPTSDDVIEPVVTDVQKLSEKIDKFIESQRNAEQDRAADDAFGRLMKAGYTEDGITKIKNIMKERTIPDVEAAAALYDKLNPPATPAPATGFEPKSWGLGIENDQDADTKLLFENEDRWAEQEAAKAWREAS